MVEFGSVSTNQRVGEVVVLGTPGIDKRNFIQSICPSLLSSEQDLLLGDLTVSTDLSLFVYGLPHQKSPEVEWELIARKMLGMIVLYRWGERESFEHAKAVAQFAELHFRAPLILAADCSNSALPVPDRIAHSGFFLQAFCRVMFYQNNQTKSIRQVFLSLIDLLIQYCDKAGQVERPPQNMSLNGLEWRLEIIYRLFYQKSILDIWTSLQPTQQVELYNFIWEKTLELGMLVKGKEFTQEGLLSHLNKIAISQSDKHTKELWTDLRVYIDKNTIETVRTTEQIDLLCKVLHHYLFGE